MCETSNIPAEDLHARCSSWIEEYHIGNSNPWKSTIFASDSRWQAYNAVRTGGLSDTNRCGSDRCNNLSIDKLESIGSFSVNFDQTYRTKFYNRWAELYNQELT